MSKRKIGSAPFSIDPKAIVKESRLHALSGNWFKGFELISKSLIGIDYDYASAILSGSGTLDLVNGQAVYSTATDSEYEQVTNEQSNMTSYFFIEDGVCYKPICHIVELRAPDGHYAFEKYNLKLSDNKEHYREDVIDKRMEFYVSEEFHHTAKKVQTSKDGKFIGVWLTPSTFQIPPWLETEGNNASFIDKLYANKTQSHLIKVDDLKNTRSNWFDKSEWIKGLDNSVDFTEASHTKDHTQSPDHKDIAQKVWAANGEEFVILSGLKVALKPLLSWGSYVCNKQLSKDRWEPISPKHWKTINDNNTHTDWVVSAGVNPEDFYSKHEDLNSAAYKFVLKCSRNKKELISKTSVELIPLVVYRESDLSGVIQHVNNPEDQIISNIIAIPDCSIKWRKVAMEIGKRGGVIIAESGGELSHLIIESDHIGATVYLSEEVVSFTKNYESVTINYESQTICTTTQNA